ncbi:anti-anti-sigma factor [Oceanobacillus zhaokaii]|uniref:Anti-anti-sigma factor n=1 Tax=Oceanobacillus zhaokaii TaxID=2052660 RepID=A0A345PGV0_9BACI|nr:STAS domain-containing protein [Oceanobacillus zhaokaii]AXI09230.1 anti-anti-sigma factor [Oceanobacillus zhaokaii]
MDSRFKVGGLEFEWELDKGYFGFDGQDAVLFWISSAMKTFFDTIEEISGEEASHLVFETTGFRQGLVVGENFEKMKNLDVEEAAQMITKTYISAGWGSCEVRNLDFTTKSVVIHIKDSWEYKVNRAQNKKESGPFLAAHYAGVFSGLFETNIWYRVVQDQLKGNEFSIIEYFPSDITATDNIHALARRKESLQIEHLEEIVKQKTKELRELVNQLSSPIIPVHEGIVVIPLIGKFDEERSENLMVKTLTSLPQYNADFLIFDMTGIENNIDTHTVNLIKKVGSAASLSGTQTVLVGVSAKLGIFIAQSGIDFTGFEFFQTLQHGIHHALAQAGKATL